MTIENSVSNDFLATLVDINNVFDCRLPSVTKHGKEMRPSKCKHASLCSEDNFSTSKLGYYSNKILRDIY